MLSGLLTLDKPGGVDTLLTSHDVVQRVRRLAGMRRVGHAGTLDPLASGVLLLCLGRTTRLVEYLVGLPKQYLATVRLGESTDTYDAQGDITAKRPCTASLPAITAALDSFRGTIQQQPPLYSAIKRNGQPLYKLARQGIEVERPWRTITIHNLTVANWDPPHLELSIDCSSGTYIRSLGHDLGEALGCGGHITQLRRTAVGQFHVDDAVPLDDLTAENIAAHLQPPVTAIKHLPAVTLSHEAAQTLFLGKKIPQTAAPDGDLVAASTPDGMFIGILRPDGAQWQPHKLFPPESP